MIFEAFAFFKDEDRISLFGQSHCRDASAKAGTDDDVIVNLIHMCALRGELADYNKSRQCWLTALEVV